LPAYHDLNLANPQLAARAKELGWASARTARVADVRRLQDIPLEAAGLLSVEGANTELLRQACRRESVSLVNPLLVPQFQRDDGLIRAVAESRKAFELPLVELLRANYVFRARFLVQARAFLARCAKLGAGVAFTSRARESYDLKSPREVMALAMAMGLTREQAAYALTRRAEEVLKRAGEPA
jgi:RNase P/RNase MRP subunit p30